jgi:hypothetical protein
MEAGCSFLVCRVPIACAHHKTNGCDVDLTIKMRRELLDPDLGDPQDGDQITCMWPYADLQAFRRRPRLTLDLALPAPVRRERKAGRCSPSHLRQD